MIIDGKLVSKKIKDSLKEQVEQEHIAARLVVIIVGNNPASKVYVRNKKNACEYIGIASEIIEYDEDVTEAVLLDKIEQLNIDNEVTGILVQLPLPKHIDEDRITLAINHKKDVDGFHPTNVGALSIGLPAPRPCTPSGIMELLKEYDIDPKGKNAVVIGRSNIVGKPIAMLLLEANATVTITHSHTKNLKEITKIADIVVVAIGMPRAIDSSYIKKGAVIIDVGINRLEDGKLCGDVDFEDVKNTAGLVTPVPGGVGPMTIAMLMKNCIAAYKSK